MVQRLEMIYTKLFGSSLDKMTTKCRIKNLQNFLDECNYILCIIDLTGTSSCGFKSSTSSNESTGDLHNLTGNLTSSSLTGGLTSTNLTGNVFRPCPKPGGGNPEPPLSLPTPAVPSKMVQEAPVCHPYNFKWEFLHGSEKTCHCMYLQLSMCTLISLYYKSYD